MGVGNLSFLHGIAFSGGGFLSEVTDLTPATNLDELIGYASGYPDPLFVANRMVKPDVRFSTPQLKTILDLCGSTFIADLSGGNTDLYYKLATNLGVRVADATTSHNRIRMATGAMYWEEIGAVHGQDATMTARIVPIYNGTNNPFVPAGSLALAGTPAAASFYTLGPVAINAATLNGVKSWRLNLGLQVLEESSGGDVYTTFCGIGQRAPVLEITSLEVGAWASYGLNGTAVSSLAFSLRKKSADGGNIADGTTGHIVFSASYGKIDVINTSGSGNTPATTTLRIPLRAPDSSTATLTFNSSTNIS